MSEPDGMVDQKYVTIYDVMFPSSETKPYKKLRNYSEDEVLRYLEVLPEDKRSVVIPKMNTDIDKRHKVITIRDNRDV